MADLETPEELVFKLEDCLGGQSFEREPERAAALIRADRAAVSAAARAEVVREAKQQVAGMCTVLRSQLEAWRQSGDERMESIAYARLDQAARVVELLSALEQPEPSAQGDGK